METTLTNRADRRMPFSFGQHPWFPTHGGALMRFAATGMWLSDREGQTVRVVPITAEADYAAPRRPPSAYSNVCYAGWDGRAEIVWLDAGVRLSLTAELSLSPPDVPCSRQSASLLPRAAEQCALRLRWARSGARSSRRPYLGARRKRFGDVTFRCFDMTRDSLSLWRLGRVRPARRFPALICAQREPWRGRLQPLTARSRPPNLFRRVGSDVAGERVVRAYQCVWRYRVRWGPLPRVAPHRRRRPPAARSTLSEGWAAVDGGSAGQGHLGRSVCSGDVGLRRQARRRLMRRTWPPNPQSPSSDRNDKADRPT